MGSVQQIANIKPTINIDSLPYEIKRLIYKHADFSTFKALRETSQSWAESGLGLLFLPILVIKSPSQDIRRLASISDSVRVSRVAAKVIRTIEFPTADWDPRYLRNIVCDRHEGRREYEVLDFVPTKAEHEALTELDGIIAHHSENERDAHSLSLLTAAFRSLSGVETITIRCGNPFKHRILRKVWDEYSLEACRPKWVSQIGAILCAALAAGLSIRHLKHEYLLSLRCAVPEAMNMPQEIYIAVSKLKSLDLAINNIQESFSLSSPDSDRWRLSRLISASPLLEALTIRIEGLQTVPLDFLPESVMPKLHTLSLHGIHLDSTKFLEFLTDQVPKLGILDIGDAEIQRDAGTWRKFLEGLRSLPNHKLEKFQISGGIRSLDGDHEAWIFWPLYNTDWSVQQNVRNKRTKEMEEFVLGTGPWPILPEDYFPDIELFPND